MEKTRLPGALIHYEGGYAMTTVDNKTLVQQFFEEIINQRNLAALGQFVSPNAVNHTVPDGLPQEPSQFLGRHLVAFPDVKTTLQDLLTDVATWVAVVTYRGSHPIA